MDLSSIKTDDRKIEIVHPGTDEPVGLSVTLMSVTDDRMKRVTRRITDQRLKLEQRGKGFKAEDIDANASDIAFSAMLDWQWSGDANFNGATPEFNRKNVMEVFEALPWLRKQIMTEISDEKSFFSN